MAVKTKKFDPQDLELTDIRILEFHIDQSHLVNKPGAKLERFRLQMGTTEAYNPQEKAAKIGLHYEITAFDPKDPEAESRVMLTVECLFKIRHFEQYVHISKDQMKVNQGLATNLMSVSYATARGIVWQLTSNTVMGGVILPVVDAGDLLNLARDKNSRTSG